MNPRTAQWIAFGAGGALLLWAFSGAASTTMVVHVGGGTMQLKAPANGRVQFLLPVGASWTNAVHAPLLEPAAVIPIGLPADRTQPLTVLVADAGAQFGLSWTNADGTAGAALIGFS